MPEYYASKKEPEALALYFSVTFPLLSLLTPDEQDCAECKDANVDLLLRGRIPIIPSCERYTVTRSGRFCFDYIS